MLEKYKDNDKIIVSIAPHAPYTVNDETFLRINKVSEGFSLFLPSLLYFLLNPSPFPPLFFFWIIEKNILINLHLHETESEIKDGSQVERMNK